MFDRISLVISQMGIGGAERVLSILSDAWVAQGVDVQLVTIASAEKDFYELNPAITRVGLDLARPAKSLSDAVAGNVRRVRALRRAITRFGPDVVLSFAPPANVTTLMAMLGTGIPVVVSERNDPAMRQLPLAWHLLRRLLYRRAAAVAVQTQSVQHWAQRNLPGATCRVIPNPVRILPAPRVQADGVKRIVAMGRLVHQKGFDLLITAFAKMGDERWHLRLIGDGPERRSLQELARRLGVAGRVEFAGKVKDPENYLAAGSLFVLSSRYEGFPNALLEAMSLGLPAISFDCPSGPSDIIRHGANGLLVSPNDVDALASSLKTMTADPQLRQRLGRAGAEAVRERFSVPEILSQWNELLESVAWPGDRQPGRGNADGQTLG